MNNRKVTVILGMHRSGTSAITKSLELFGINLGEKLHGASFDNPKGFWEDEECLRINQELLNIDGYEYDSIIKTPDLESKKVKTLFYDAVSLVSKNLDEYKWWAFKDPRTCRYLEFWQSVFEAIGCEVSYIFVLRNPISVAKSLKKRNNLELEKSYILWAQHVYMAVSSMNHRCLFLDYDDFMDNNEDNIWKISKFLNVEPHVEKINEYSTQFLSNKLRHTKFTGIDVINSNAIPNFVKAIFLPIDRLAKSKRPNYEIDKNLIDEISSSDFVFICNYIESLERQQKECWLLLSDKENVIKEYQLHTNQLEEKAADLTEKYNKLEYELNRKETELLRVKSSRVYRLVKKIQGVLSR